MRTHLDRHRCSLGERSRKTRPRGIGRRPLRYEALEGRQLLTVTLDIEDPAPITEGNSGTKEIVFEVVLSGAHAEPVMVDFATDDGMAEAGSDYTAKTETVTFPATELLTQTAQVHVTILGDTESEGSEFFYGILSNATPAEVEISKSDALAFIEDDDGLMTTTVGLYDPANALFFLRNSNDSGVADVAFPYGLPGADWVPTAGDWDSDGQSTTGLFDPVNSLFFLRNSNDSGVADEAFAYGMPGADWIPIAGDWDSDGQDTVGLYDPVNSLFFLRNSNDSGVADVAFAYGMPGANWIPIAGDWDGDGQSTAGLFDPASSLFFLRNSNDSGVANVSFAYGLAGAGWLPIAGDWEASSLHAIGSTAPGANAAPLDRSAIQPTVNEAIARWAGSAGGALPAEALSRARVVVADLPGSLLGRVVGTTIYLDRDAAGHGWFIDPTPSQDEEFSRTGPGVEQRAIDPRAVDRIDLLTVLEHELGHAGGIRDLGPGSSDLMSGTLSAGVRRTPTAKEVDAILGGAFV